MMIILLLLLFVLTVPLGIAAQQWLFNNADAVHDPEWELYQQRYD
jgi:hypothetical protein